MKLRMSAKAMQFVKWVVILMIICSLSVTCFGLGVGPAKTVITYEKPQVEQKTFHIFKDVDRTVDVHLEVNGALAPYIILPITDLSLTQELTPVSFNISIVEGLLPGPNEAKILVTEKSAGSGNSIGNPSIALPHKVIVNMPYPDKHITAQVKVKDNKDSVDLVTIVENTGSKTISDIHSEYEIYEKDSSIMTLMSPKITLDPKKSGSIIATIDKKDLKGVYETTSVIHFDDKQLEIHKSFQIGNPTLILTNFDKYFIADEVNKMSFETYNDWNVAVEDVMIEITINDADDRPVTHLKTFTFGIGAQENRVVDTHWDTTGLKRGTYPATITIHHGKEQVKKSTNFMISTKEETEALKQDEQDDTKELLVIIILILFLILLIGAIVTLYIFVKKK